MHARMNALSDPSCFGCKQARAKRNPAAAGPNSWKVSPSLQQGACVFACVLTSLNLAPDGHDSHPSTNQMLHFFRTLFVTNRDLHFCALRSELLMALHDQGVSEVCGTSPLARRNPLFLLVETAIPALSYFWSGPDL